MKRERGACEKREICKMWIPILHVMGTDHNLPSTCNSRVCKFALGMVISQSVDYYSVEVPDCFIIGNGYCNLPDATALR
jgi:hypothetical protein